TGGQLRGHRGRAAGPLVGEGRGSTLSVLLRHHVVGTVGLVRQDEGVRRVDRDVPNRGRDPTALTHQLLELLGQPARGNHTSTLRTRGQRTVVDGKTLSRVRVLVLTGLVQVTEERELRAAGVEARVTVHSGGVAGADLGSSLSRRSNLGVTSLDLRQGLDLLRETLQNLSLVRDATKLISGQVTTLVSGTVLDTLDRVLDPVVLAAKGIDVGIAHECVTPIFREVYG